MQIKSYLFALNGMHINLTFCRLISRNSINSRRVSPAALRSERNADGLRIIQTDRLRQRDYEIVNYAILLRSAAGRGREQGHGTSTCPLNGIATITVFN